MFKSLSFFLLYNCLFINAAEILYISVLPSPSHHIFNSAICNELANRGHNVTVISPDLDKNPPAGVHYIHMENQYNEIRDGFLREALGATKENSPFLDIFLLQSLCVEYCRSK